MNLRDIAAASPFAHLLGLAKPKAKAAEDDEVPQGPARTTPAAHLAGMPSTASDKPAAEGPEAAEDEEEDGEEEAAAETEATTAESPAEEEQEDDPDEEDDDREMAGDTPAAQARARERARCAAIFGDAAAGVNPALAAELAFNTMLPRAQAVGVLRAGAASGLRAGLRDRMAAAPNPSLGDEPSRTAPRGDADEAAAIAAQCHAAAAKARGSKS